MLIVVMLKLQFSFQAMKRSSKFLVCFVMCVIAVGKAQTNLPNEALSLSRIRQQMRKNLSQLPDYTCTESIFRQERSGASAPFRLIDSLRVEVLHSDEKELFAWPGSKKFDERLMAVVGSGLTSSGEFAIHARNIFIGDAQTTYAGEEALRGRQTLKFDYQIPAFSSAMTVTLAGQSGRVSTRGSFWADADTLDLLRLDVHADDIPPNLPVAAVVSTVDYGRVHIGQVDSLLPQSGQTELTYLSKSANRNLVQFSQCRAFRVESALRLEPTSLLGTEIPRDVERTQEIELPADIHLSVRLENAIDSKDSTEGDLIKARLELPVKGKAGILIPTGALVEGRIRRLESYDKPRRYFVVGLEFTEINFDGKRVAFTGGLERVDALRGLTWNLSSSKTRQTLDVVGITDFYENEHVRTFELPGVGTFFVDGGQFRLPAGFRMVWRTLAFRKL